MTTILVTGATGTVGSKVVKQLSAKGGAEYMYESNSPPLREKIEYMLA